ncbi:MAG: MFS transporter [Desulfohalobiaceae bacterium]|nr:MFS transporter [Desulfohalobiaceae bacterium]
MSRQPAVHWAWVILIVCFVNLFINYSVRLGYGVVLPEMIKDLGLSRTGGGSIYNAYLMTYLTLTPFTGYLTDRLGARRVISTCACILGLGVLLMGTVQSLRAGCLAFAVVGIGATGMWTPVLTVVQRWFALSRRGMALGILSTGYGLGFACMGLVFPLIVAGLNWRFAWYFLGVGALIMVLFNAFLLRSDPESSGTRPWGGSDKSARPAAPTLGADCARIPFSQVLASKNFWLIGLSYFCIAYSLYGITTFMVDYAEQGMHIPLATASKLATVHGLSQIAGVLIILPCSDIWGRKKTTLLSNACIAMSIMGILLANSQSLLFLCVGVMAVFYGVTFPVYGACAGDYFPKKLIGTVIGAWTPFYGLGAILVHWVSGLIFDASGSYHLPFLIALAMSVLAVVLMAAVSPRREGGDR